jgi:hypothetical protein
VVGFCKLQHQVSWQIQLGSCKSQLFKTKSWKKCQSQLRLIFSLELWEFSDNCTCTVQQHTNYLILLNCNGWQQWHKWTCQHNLSLFLLLPTVHLPTFLYLPLRLHSSDQLILESARQLTNSIRESAQFHKLGLQGEKKSLVQKIIVLISISEMFLNSHIDLFLKSFSHIHVQAIWQPSYYTDYYFICTASNKCLLVCVGTLFSWKYAQGSSSSVIYAKKGFRRLFTVLQAFPLLAHNFLPSVLISCNLKVYCHVHKNLPLVPILSHTNLVHAFQSFFCKIHFNYPPIYV